MVDLRSRPTCVAGGAGSGVVVGCVTGEVWRVDVRTRKAELVSPAGGGPVSVLGGNPVVVGTAGEDTPRLFLDGRDVLIDRDDACAIEPVADRAGAVSVVCAGGDVLLADFLTGSSTPVGRRWPAVAVAAAGVEIDAGAAGVYLALDGDALRALASRHGLQGRVVALTSGPGGTFLHSTGGSLARLAPPAPSARGRVTVVADPDAGSLGRRVGVSGWSGGVAVGAGLVVRVHPGGPRFEWAAESAWSGSTIALCCGDMVVTWDVAGTAGPRVEKLGSAATGVVRIGGTFATVHADGTVRAFGAGTPAVLGCTRLPLLGTLTGDGWTVGVSLGGEVVHLGRRAA